MVVMLVQKLNNNMFNHQDFYKVDTLVVAQFLDYKKARCCVNVILKYMIYFPTDRFASIYGYIGANPKFYLKKTTWSNKDINNYKFYVLMSLNITLETTSL